MVKGRRLSIKPKSDASSDINVTPLVDVVLVLLIIFMVVTPLLEKDIAVRVPSSEPVTDVTQVPPDQVLVRVLRSGELKINGHPVAMAELAGRVGSLLAGRGADDKIVFVSPDDDASYGHLVSVFDRVREGGAVTLGMTTEPPPSGE
ncbi:MAG TPA: biopolymer transporter ExbD [Polyangiaceae bacterium]|nr:biopolymer transporter ExbD [Polyangiaceae bacterium]